MASAETITTDRENPGLVLASASARRRDLLRQIGIEPNCIDPADIDEAPLPSELPRVYAARMAAAKLEAMAGRHGDSFVLSADTVVAVGRRILPKANDADTAQRCLALLSGARHRVYGGVNLRAPDGTVIRRLVMTGVTFKRLSKSEVDRYLDSGEWDGKAGGYAIQGRAAAFVRRLSGSYSNVVGLPLFETSQLLHGAGWR